MADPSIELFEAERSRLTSLAYRMLGTPDDADDVVQEAWLRWERADRPSIDRPPAWLTTVTTRLAIDRLTSAQRRREVYVGPWLPEPLVAVVDDPLDQVASSETLTLGFLRVLETLGPVERAVFLLHDVFGMPFAEVATAVERTEATTRQIAKRARERVQAGRPRVEPDPAEIEELSLAFLGAVLDGDIERLAGMLTDDVVHLSDGGPDHHAARRPVRGPTQVARLMINIARRELRPDDGFHWVEVNGQFGSYVVREGEPFLLTVLGWRDGKVAETLSIVNPDKLRRFHLSWLAGQG
jgi:RNA polymerase sigma-70 factor (ECF subfamily)